MRRIVFAWVEFEYDFDSKEEAREYMNAHDCYEYYFVDKEPVSNGDGMWSLRVRKLYNKKYLPGW